MTEPLYFMIWSTHELCINTSIATIRTGCGKIEYNPDFVASLGDKELYQVLQAEVLRILLKHPYSRKKDNMQLGYLASNITLGEYGGLTIGLPTAESIFGTGALNRKHFELYYAELEKLAASRPKSSGENGKQDTQGSDDAEETENKQSGGGGGEQEDTDASGQEQASSHALSKPSSEGNDGGEGAAGSTEAGEGGEGAAQSGQPTGDAPEGSQPEGRGPGQPDPTLSSYLDHEATGEENTADWDQDELMQEQIKEKIETAEQNSSWGSVRGSLKETILATLVPKADYRAILKAFRASLLAQERTLTRMRPSRRYGFQFMGSKREFSTKLLVAIDVSGSMTSRDIAQGYSVVNHFFKYGITQIDVLQFDAELQGPVMSLKKARSKIQVLGRGGTCFQPIFDYLDKHLEYDGLIVFTDGYSHPPVRGRNKRTQVLWLIDSEQHYKSRQELLSPVGRCAFLRE